MMTYEIWGDDSGPCCLIQSTSHTARELAKSFGCELLKTFDANGSDEANQVFDDMTLPSVSVQELAKMANDFAEEVKNGVVKRP